MWNNTPYAGPPLRKVRKILALKGKDGEHCGCCTYLSMMDPILHSIVAQQGDKLAGSAHCKCCKYWRSKGVHRDLARAKRYRRGTTA